MTYQDVQLAKRVVFDLTDAINRLHGKDWVSLETIAYLEAAKAKLIEPSESDWEMDD